MRRPILILINTLYQACAALWIGALVGIGAMAAPAAFSTLGRSLDSPAGVIIGRSLTRATSFSVALLSVMVLVSVFEMFYRRRINTKRLLLARALLTLAAFLAAVYISQQWLPQMEVRRAIGDQAAFDAMHRSFVHIAQAQVLLGVALLALTNSVNIGPRRDGGHPR